MKKLFILLCLLFVLCSCSDMNTNEEDDNNQQENIQTEKELTKDEISAVYQNTALYVKNLLINPQISSLSYQESTNYDTLSSVVALVKLASNLYSDEDFVVSSEFVEFDLVLGDSALKMMLLTETNVSENKLVATYIYYSGNEAINEQTPFVQISVDYNFETSEISGFEIRQASCAGEQVNLHFKYDGTKFYEFDPSNEPTNQEEYDLVVSTTISIRNEYILKIENVVKLNKDYSNEYLEAMAYAFN